MKILHTMLRVGDLQRSIDFYTSVMGMKVLRTTGLNLIVFFLSLYALRGFGVLSWCARTAQHPKKVQNVVTAAT